MEETRSQLNISPLTLLTRIGGIIGVGKEFLWIIITLATYLISVYSNICKYSFRWTENIRYDEFYVMLTILDKSKKLEIYLRRGYTELQLSVC